jgi:hypothetical protein
VFPFKCHGDKVIQANEKRNVQYLKQRKEKVAALFKENWQQDEKVDVNGNSKKTQCQNNIDGCLEIHGL